MVTHRWDARTGIQLPAIEGDFIIHPDRQTHIFEVATSIAVKDPSVSCALFSRSATSKVWCGTRIYKSSWADWLEAPSVDSAGLALRREL
jgi:hypothetical protein